MITQHLALDLAVRFHVQARTCTEVILAQFEVKTPNEAHH